MVSLKFAGTIAAGTGTTLEETAAVLQVLANAGVAASQAGTSLRAILLALSNPTARAVREFEELDIAIGDINPSARSLFEVFETLTGASLNVAVAAGAVRRRAAGALVAISRGTDVLKIFIEQNKIATGESKRLSDAIAPTLSFALILLADSLKEVFFALGANQKNLTKFVTTMSQAILVIVGSEARLGEITDAMLAQAKVVARRIEAIGVGIGVFVAFKVAVIAVTTAMRALNLAIAGNPIGLIAVIVSSAIAALILFRDHMIQIGDVSFRVLDLVHAGWLFLWRRIKIVAEGVGRVFLSFRLSNNKLTTDFQRDFEGMTVVQTVKDWAFDAFEEVKKVVNRILQLFFSLKNSLDVVFKSLTRIFTG